MASIYLSLLVAQDFGVIEKLRVLLKGPQRPFGRNTNGGALNICVEIRYFGEDRRAGKTWRSQPELICKSVYQYSNAAILLQFQ
jgi:hypothetical protein